MPVSAVITPDSALTRATPKSATLMSWKGATGNQFEVNFGCSIVEDTGRKEYNKSLYITKKLNREGVKNAKKIRGIQEAVG